MSLFTIFEEFKKNHWYYKFRRKIITEHLTNNSFILDVGSGTGYLASELLKKGFKVVGLDIDMDAIPYLKSREVNFVIGDGNSLPFKGESFDFILAIDVLEHIKDDKKFLSSLVKVIKKGGGLIINVPAIQSLWTERDRIYGHLRRYGKSELINKLNSIQLKVEKIKVWNCLLAFPIFFIRHLIFRKDFDAKKELLKEKEITNRHMNKLLYNLLAFEWKLQIPFGSSLFVFCKKL